MLCIILYVFFYKKYPKLKINLEAGSREVAQKFYEKIGFTYKNLKCTLDDIVPLITEKCLYCSEDVKLIIQVNKEYTTILSHTINTINKI